MPESELPSLIVTGAGEGVRLEPVTSVIPKCFLPIAIHNGDSESAVSRLIRQFRAAGVEQVWLAASNHGWFESFALQRTDVSVVVAEPRGEWSAVIACVENGRIVGSTIIVSGDNVLSDRDIEAFVAHAACPRVECLIGASFAESTARYTRLEVTGGCVRNLVEKPAEGGPGLAKAGLYYFNSSALAAAMTEPYRMDRFGELSMTEVLLGRLDMGLEVTCHPLGGGFCDIGDVNGFGQAIRQAAKWLDSGDR